MAEALAKAGPSDSQLFAEMAKVLWDSGAKGDYKIGRRGKYQIQLAPGAAPAPAGAQAHVAASARAGTGRRRSVVFGDDATGEGGRINALER